MYRVLSIHHPECTLAASQLGVAGCPAAAHAGSSLGECAAIGVGMALGMVALVLASAVAWRAWRRRVHARFGALNVALLQTTKERDEFQLEGLCVISVLLMFLQYTPVFQR